MAIIDITCPVCEYSHYNAIENSISTWGTTYTCTRCKHTWFVSNPSPKDEGQFIIMGGGIVGTSHSPSRMFTSKKQAEKVAEKLATENVKVKYTVLRLISSFQAIPVPVQIKKEEL